LSQVRQKKKRTAMTPMHARQINEMKCSPRGGSDQPKIAKQQDINDVRTLCCAMSFQGTPSV
jgi:hypothetical protein